MAEPVDSASRSSDPSGVDPKAKALPLLRLDEVGGRVGAWCLEHQRLVIAAAILAGLVCRLVQYLWRISFWHDEAFLVLNVSERSGWGLVGTLDAAKGAPQSAPPAFMLLTKALTQWLGNSEFVFRAIPMVCSIGAMVLFAWLARRLLTPGAAMLAVWMICLSWKMLDHAAEFKQYSGDVLVSVVLLALAVGWEKGVWWRRLLAVSVTAAGLMWFSETAVFVFAGVSLAMLLETGWKPRRLTAWAAMCLIPVVSFVVLYLVSIRHQQAPELYSYWDKQLLQPGDWWKWPWWAVNRLRHAANYACEPLGPVTLVAGVVAAWLWWKAGRRVLATSLVLPILITLTAATFGRYPMGGRVTLFLAPMFLLLGAQGIVFCDGLLERWRPWRGVWRLVPAAIVGCMVVAAAYYLVFPRNVQHVRPAAEFVQRHWNGQDRIYVLRTAWNPFLVYWPDGREPLKFSHELTSSPDEQSFWLVVGYAADQGPKARRQSLELCDAVAQRGEQYIGTGGAAIHYTRRPATQPGVR